MDESKLIRKTFQKGGAWTQTLLDMSMLSMLADSRGSIHLRFLAGCLQSFLVRIPGLMPATLLPSHSCLGSQREYFKIQTGYRHFSCLKPLQVSHLISHKIQTFQSACRASRGPGHCAPRAAPPPQSSSLCCYHSVPYSVTGNCQASHRAL